MRDLQIRQKLKNQFQDTISRNWMVVLAVVCIIASIAMCYSPIPISAGTEIQPYNKLERFSVGIAGGVILWVVALFLNSIFDYTHRIHDWFLREKEGFACFVRIAVASAIVSAILTFFVKQFSWSTYVFFLLFFLVCGVLSIICYVTTKKMKIETLVFILLWMVGLAIIWLYPVISYGWDAPAHYRSALESSAIAGSVGLTNSDYYILANALGELNKSTLSETVQAVNAGGMEIVTQFPRSIQLVYLPVGITIAVARLFSVPFMVRYNLGRMMQLLIYSICCYFGIKRLHSGKMFLSVIAFFPTSMLLATNYSYDYWVTAFSILGMSYFIGASQEEGEISRKDTIIMCLSFAICAWPKQIYAPIALFPLLMRREKYREHHKRYIFICILGIALIFVNLFARSFREVAGSGDVRGGAGVNPSGQVEFILSNFSWYLSMLVSFLKDYLNFFTNNWNVDLAYLGLGVGSGIFTFLMFFTMVTDKDQMDRGAFSLPAKIYAVLYFFGGAALIATSLYIAYNEVGNTWILGCQRRYIYPLLFPLTIVFGRGIRLRHIPQKVYCCAILGVLFVLNYYNVIDQIIVGGFMDL